MNTEPSMQNGVVFFQESTNIGDDIQTYAASLHIDNPAYLERERLDQVKEKSKIICNGWFMEDANHWPPSDAIHPLFISFHISTKNIDLMTSKKAIDYYKKYEPIGCRDYHTLTIMKKHKVKSYFSGCLTLTLPKYSGTKSNEILFVDVLRTNYTKNYRDTIVKNIIPESYQNKVTYISHITNDLKLLDKKTRIKQAKNLLDRYAKAKIVFTSLIHCALPCVAMGTPVVFIDFGFNNDKAKRDRFNGIIDLFKIESNLKAPYMDRNLSSKLFRGLRFIHLNKKNINQLSEELFEYTETTEKHLLMVNSMKATIKEFYNS